MAFAKASTGKKFLQFFNTRSQTRVNHDAPVGHTGYARVAIK
jgi:hypothetical protein